MPDPLSLPLPSALAILLDTDDQDEWPKEANLLIAAPPPPPPPPSFLLVLSACPSSFAAVDLVGSISPSP
ncbi:unnamed protein product [Urochloa humidicola]